MCHVRSRQLRRKMDARLEQAPRALQALRSQKYSGYGAIYGTVANSVQRLLEKLGGGDPDALWQPQKTVTA